MAATVTLATRGSSLALVQARHVAAILSNYDPELTVELAIVTTKGDRGQRKEDGAFVREVQNAVLDGRAQIAVHSLKDVPTETVSGLTLGATPPREDVREVVLSRVPLEELKSGRIGTGSLRRQAQLSWLLPRLAPKELVGNVDSRVRQLWQGDFDAIVVAAAGLKRLGYIDSDGLLHRDVISDAISVPLQDLDLWEATVYTDDVFLPAAAQACLGLECRSDDVGTLGILAAINDSSAFASVVGERAVLQDLRAGCRTPVAVTSRISSDTLQISALVASVDGRTVVRADESGPLIQAIETGRAVAQKLKALGADAILAALPNA